MNLKQELHTWQEIPLAGNETETGKIQIFPEFPDPEGLLESAYAFLKRLKAPPMKLWTKQRSTEKYEEYFLNVLQSKMGDKAVEYNDAFNYTKLYIL